MSSVSGNNIKVVCRFRPFNRLEREQNSTECVDIDLDTDTVRIKGGEKDGFTFDKVFPSESQQPQIFDFGVKGIVTDVMAGFNGTLFCYGQTGSGKSYTMMGADITSPDLKGLIPRITEQIFQSIATADANVEYTVKVSYMEIYMEKIRDLLAPVNDNLTIHEDKARGVHVKGLTEVYVGTDTEVYGVMSAGSKARVTTATNMNAESSRSHSIFVIGIHQRNVETGSQKSGHLYLVDLAGSEKVGKTGASGQTLEEAKKINKSLSALGMVINSLTDGKSTHIPYRDSKLTRLLQESLGGNSRTTLIINCSPASYNEQETLSTLRFGMRAKSIKNKARINTEMSPAELKVMLSKIKGELFFCETYRDALLGEVSVWRTGGSVAEGEWTTEEKVRLLVIGNGGKAPAALIPATPSRTPSHALSTGTSTPSSRSPTPGFDGLSTPGGRITPATTVALDLDERDEFLRRENELEDQVAEKESALAAQEKDIADMKDELTYLRERNEQLSKGNATVDLELAELRASQERLEEDAKENAANLELAKDREAEMSNEIDRLKMQVQELQQVQAVAAADDREKRKADMLAEMMAKIDTGGAFLDTGSEKLRNLLSQLDSTPDEAAAAGLILESRETIRRHLADNQGIIRDLQDRSRRSQEDLELLEQRKDEMEDLLAQREAAYEELLSSRTVEFSGADDLKAQYDAQYAAKQTMLEGECTSLRKRLNAKEDELNRLQATIEDQAASAEDMNRMLAQATAGIDGGREFALASQELDRTRRAAELQQTEFEAMKRNLMRDVTDRCEKVVELQMQLDELKEKYKAVARATNAKAHNKKMQILEFNMAQLNEVQRGLVHQNTSLKKDLNAAERKLSERKERIINLERLFAQSEAQLKAKDSEYQRHVRELRDQVAQSIAREQALGTGQGLGFGRIAKPLRGGGGAPMIQPGQMSPSYSSPGGMSQSTLNRMQDEAGSMKRQSWFSSLSKA